MMNFVIVDWSILERALGELKGTILDLSGVLVERNKFLNLPVRSIFFEPRVVVQPKTLGTVAFQTHISTIIRANVISL